MPRQEWLARTSAALDYDIERSFEALPQQEGAEIMEGIFGAHGFRLFDRFPFEIHVSLPGDTYRSNATGTADGALLWEFDNDTFVLRDYVVEARSRIVYPSRIKTAGIVLGALLALALAWILWHQRLDRDGSARQ